MNIKQEWKDALRHLRLHFSLLLMPIFLFALSQALIIDTSEALMTFFLLHVFIYPASNAYNSYHDKDIGSIGGIKNPPPVNRKVLLLANILDSIALLVSLLMGFEFFILILIYISISRLYSNRTIRLKKYPYIAFFIIFIFQGAFTYYLCSFGIGKYWGNPCSAIGWKSYTSFFNYHAYALMACSFQIGAIYPLTQIYQHQNDLKDGVTTISFKLGINGTFLFSGALFTLATLFYFLFFKETNVNSFYLLLIAQFPIVFYFMYWLKLVLQDPLNANFKHTMRLNIISAVVLNLFFLYLVIYR